MLQDPPSLVLSEGEDVWEALQTTAWQCYQQPSFLCGKKKDGHVIASRGREAAENPGDPNPSLFLHEHPVGNNLASLGCSIPRGCEPYGQHQVFVLRQDLNVLELTL